MRCYYSIVLSLLCAAFYAWQARGEDICAEGEHVLGTWVNGSRTQKTYYSCGWDHKDNLQNPTVCGWSPRVDEQLMYGHGTWLTQTGGHAYSCDKRDNTRNTVTQRERYEWKPLTCDLLPWNATQFCELMGNRTFLFIGDSTMHQTAAGLMSQLTSDGARCAPQLAVGRIDFLGPIDKPMHFVNQVKPDVVFLNTGAHFMVLQSFLDDLKLLEPLVERIRDTGNVTVVWK
ncbi:hypothetical protein B484DRAFT_440061, partial [Ochromonadaceae sp. CCMP2298]